MEITIWILSIVISVLIMVLIYSIKTGIKKMTDLEDQLKEFELDYDSLWAYIGAFEREIHNTYEKMKIIDRSGMFASDDEVGVIFTRLKNSLEQLDNFINEANKTETTEN